MTPSAHLRICHGSRCLSKTPRRMTVLHDGEWLESRSFFCISVGRKVRCLNDIGAAAS